MNHYPPSQRHLLSNYATAMEDQPDTVKVFLDWTTSFEKFLSDRFQVYLRKLIGLLSEIVAEGRKNGEFGQDVNPIDAALMIYSSANTLVQIKFFNEEIDISHYIFSLISAVLHIDEEQAKQYSQTTHSAMFKLPDFSQSKTAPTLRDKKRTLWQSHIESWQASKLTQAAYCKQSDINLATFTYWRTKLK